MAPDFRAEIDVNLKPVVSDPQGKSIENGLHHLGFEFSEVRAGKHLTFELEAPTVRAARRRVEAACKTFLANPVMETYTFRVSRIKK